MIICENITLSYNGNTILQDLSFRVNKGQKACINGVSGKGKSSVIKLLQGYVMPDRGVVKVNGTNLTADTVHQVRRSLAWVPQNIDLPVNNGRSLMDLLGMDDDGQAGHYAGKLGLSPAMLTRPFDEISGGQKQRIIIAVCLALDREIILLDEPTASLDDQSIDHLVEVMKELDQKTVLSASHNRQWHAHADKIITL